jgi:hypothetical protein
MKRALTVFAACLLINAAFGLFVYCLLQPQP